MEQHNSEEEYLDKIEGKPTKKKKFGMDEGDFIEIIQFYPCLFEKSQTPAMRIKKQDALQAVENKIKKMHAIDLNSTQIRKKIENMKGRIKAKEDKKRRANFPIKLKSHERRLLNLMDYQNNPILKKIPDVVECDVPGTSKDSDESEEVFFQDKDLPGPSSSIPQLQQVVPSPKKNIQCLILELQKEVLIEQKELNQQQKELNVQQKEIFASQKEKLLLEVLIEQKELNQQQKGLNVQQKEIFALQKEKLLLEVLIEQKELNQQQKELNVQQKEIFALQKEKVLLEIDLLKRKQK